MNIGEQVAFLFILAIPIASIAWTVTHEDIFREARDWCKQNSQTCRRLYRVKPETFCKFDLPSPFTFLNRFAAGVEGVARNEGSESGCGSIGLVGSFCIYLHAQIDALHPFLI